MIEINSSVLSDEDFKYTVDTLIKASEVDHEEKFRQYTLEYINDTSDSNDDMFFFDMLEFTRFLVPGEGDNDSHIAYTDPIGLIYLNCPNKNVPKDYKVWEFIYDHECLHQLWETFDVAKRIKDKKLEYNHTILNIASDCVINDYLKRIRHKTPFEDGIFPEVLKEKFDVDYDPRTDTQFSLYVKLLEKKKEIEKDKDIMDKANDHHHGDSSQQSGDNNQSGDSGDEQEDGNDGNDGNNGNNGKQDGNQDNKENGKNGKDGQSGDDNGDEQKDGKDGQNGDDNGDEQENGKNGKDGQSGDEQEDEKGSKGEKDGNKKDSANAQNDENGKPGQSTWGRGTKPSNEKQVDANLDEIRKKIQDVKNNYADKLTGDIGKFVEKCQSSAKCENNGLVLQTTSRGISGWDVDMQKIINKHVQRKVFQMHKQYEPTYKRPRRGYAVKTGDPLKPDRRLKEDKFVINFAFYLDKSGSMIGMIDNVFEAAYKICEIIKKKYGKDKVVEGTEFKIYAFDDYIYEIEYGKRCKASNGNMDFGELSEKIVELTNDYLVNIIITDAQFDVNETKASKFIESLKGILVFIINNKEMSFKKLAEKYSSKLFYIEADPQFKLNK